MAAMGKAMMGTGEAEGENRAIRAAEAAISNPLLEDTSMSGARGLLINITGGDDLTLYEVDQAANRIREEVDDEAEIIFGSAIDESLQGKIRVSVVATGIDTPPGHQAHPPRLKVVGGGDHVAIPAVPRDSGVREAGILSGGTVLPGVAQGGLAQGAYAQAGAHAQAGLAQAGPVAQLRATASEQLAPVFIEQDAGAAAAALQDPMMAHSTSLPYAEPVTVPADDAVVGTHHQAAPSPTISPGGSRTLSPAGRGQANSLFAPAQKIASVSAPAPRPASAEPHRSLFGRVTGVLGFRHIPEPEIQSEPAVSVESAPASEPVGPTVRQTTAEDIGIGIPKFLLRQTSGAIAPQRR